MAARAGLLEQDSDRAVDVGIGRALAVVEIVERLFGVVELAQFVEGPGVVARDPRGQLHVPHRRQRMGPSGNAGLDLDPAEDTGAILDVAVKKESLLASLNGVPDRL